MITHLDPCYGPCDVREMSKRIDWRSRLVKVDYYPGLDARLACVANALSLIDVEAGNPQTLPIFRNLVGKGYRLDLPYGGGGPSTCAMVGIGLLRRLGVSNESIREGYVVGSGMRVAHRWARTLGAFVEPGEGRRPLPGDIVDLRPYPKSDDRSNHTEICIGYAQGGKHIVCVAGGQVGLGRLQSIHVTRRLFSDRFSGQREVYGWIDIERLEYSGPVTVPEGVLQTGGG